MMTHTLSDELISIRLISNRLNSDLKFSWTCAYFISRWMTFQSNSWYEGLLLGGILFFHILVQFASYDHHQNIPTMDMKKTEIFLFVLWIHFLDYLRTLFGDLYGLLDIRIDCRNLVPLQ